MTDNQIIIKELSKVYDNGFDALKKINLNVKQGEILAMLGPNGAGKTTLISIICGIVTPSSGTVTVDGFDIIKNYQKFNIHHMLNRAIGLISKEIASNSIKIEEDYDVSIPDIIGNISQLIQALLNILKNAVDVLGHGGKIISRTRICRNFTIGAIRHRFVAQIDIEDDGPGIDPAIKDTIFLPKVSPNKGFGLGLGLSISQTLIAQHGGLIECQSFPGKTIFTIFLPIIEEKVN